MRDAEAYRTRFQALLPTGAAWPRDAESTLTGLFSAWADELARVDGRGGDLIDEADPRAAFELLEDWERVAGLPDPCTGGADTLQERRLELTARLTELGGQSRQFFIDLAAGLGYAAITIEEFRPFIAGLGRCNDDLLNGGHEVRFNWRVAVPGPRVTLFRTGESRIGDKLGSIDRAEDLACLLTRLKPAHTNLIVAYEGA